MKNNFILLILVSLMLKSLSEEIPQIGNILARQKISLNGKWNYIVDVTTSLVELVNSSDMDYFEETKNRVKNLAGDLRSVGFKIRGIRKIVLQEDPTLGGTIPEVKSVEQK